ncbi:MAG: DUF1732 domain-containing protein [Planctomycetes bacterium]|nr:DUF1732 domain-containing protein [Planctomycetota bacterium]
MTGVGLAAGSTEVGDLRIEVRTVNGRSLAQKHRLSSACAGFEAGIEAEVRRRLRRGTVTVIVERQVAPASPCDPEVVRAAAVELKALAADLGLQPPTLAEVVSWANACSRQDAVVSRPLPPAFAALLGAALDDLERHRIASGEATVAALSGHLDDFERDLERAGARAPLIADHYRERLLQRVAEFVQQHVPGPVPAADLVREVAIHADRIDVAEELQRLRAHTAECRDLLRGEGEVGRRLEFLLQELLRETNTLGSKSPDTELSHTVVAMKSHIDRLKEQVANLE